MGEALEAPLRKDEIDESKDGPDRGEDEEVDLRGRHGAPVASPPVCD